MNAIHAEWKAIQAAVSGWPTWAYWRAMDADGRWHYYECEPVCAQTCWVDAGGRHQLAPPFDTVPDWRESLQRRRM